jgi:hypothetical protein
MEKPYTGRATVSDSLRGFSIEIPPKRNWVAIIFMTGWLGGWLMGEIFALGIVFKAIQGQDSSFGSFFVLFWLIAWTAGGFFAFKSLLWMIAGKEVINFKDDALTVDRKGALFYTPKTYNLREVKNFEINVPTRFNGLFGTNSNSSSWNLNGEGIFKFDYGLKTIKIGEGLDEAEGRYLLEVIKNKSYIKE